jgi:hypothetical protein
MGTSSPFIPAKTRSSTTRTIRGSTCPAGGLAEFPVDGGLEDSICDLGLIRAPTFQGHEDLCELVPGQIAHRFPLHKVA